MISISIALDDIIVNPTQSFDWHSLRQEELLLSLSQIYSFLPAPLGIAVEGETATVESPFDSQKTSRQHKLLERATDEANRGRYAQAVKLLNQLLEHLPDSVDGRRNLGMAYLEMGQPDLAEKHLLEAYHLGPQDAYTLLLLGNIYLEKKGDEATAERFYLRAVEANPDDPHILSNMAGLLARREAYSTAQDYFRRAIAVDPAYPNAPYGLALIHVRQGEPQTALTVLDTLFAQPESMDIRAEPVYAEARRLYGQINLTLAQDSQEHGMAYIEQWRDELEKEGASRLNSSLTTALRIRPWLRLPGTTGVATAISSVTARPTPCFSPIYWPMSYSISFWNKTLVPSTVIASFVLTTRPGLMPPVPSAATSMI